MRSEVNKYMVIKSVEATVQAYSRGIAAFGVENYAACGAQKERGFLAVAACLHERKRQRMLTLDGMVTAYRNAAMGVPGRQAMLYPPGGA